MKTPVFFWVSLIFGFSTFNVNAVENSPKTTSTSATNPSEIIEKQGALALIEGKNYYIFEKSGVFRSGPVGMSGRTFFGFWKSSAAEPPLFEVIARRGWINGISVSGVYNRISFYIGSGIVKEGQPGIWSGAKKPVFSGYWFIDALEKVEKPADFEKREANLTKEERSSF